ncbi:MAG: hypothetical protein ACRDX8_14290, partial [Acidimicrobiales bacterium]
CRQRTQPCWSSSTLNNVIIGDGATCGSNTFYANLDVTHTAGAVLVVNDAIRRALTVTANTGGQLTSISGDHVGAKLTCSANTPAPTGVDNQVLGTDSCPGAGTV